MLKSTTMSFATQKLIFCLSILAVSFCNCTTTHQITRSGYQIRKPTTAISCKVIFKKNFNAKSPEFEKLGEIQLGQHRFYTSCSEKDALKILKQEACQLNANLVNITEETTPDKGKGCYSCSAEFYKLTVPAPELKNDERYHAENVKERGSHVPSKAAWKALPIVLIIMLSTIIVSNNVIKQ